MPRNTKLLAATAALAAAAAAISGVVVARFCALTTTSVDVLTELTKMAGHPDADLVRPTIKARAADELRRSPDGKIHFARVVATNVDGRYVVRNAGGQGSHQLAVMAVANALVVLPDGDGVAAGAEVDMLLLD